MFSRGGKRQSLLPGGPGKALPLSEAFTFDYFLALPAEEKQQAKSVKAILATEQRIPGLGNGVLQDILYNACLHPKRKWNTLSEEEKRVLFSSVKDTLKEMVRQGEGIRRSTFWGSRGSTKHGQAGTASAIPAPAAVRRSSRKLTWGAVCISAPAANPYNSPRRSSPISAIRSRRSKIFSGSTKGLRRVIFR